MSLLGRNNETEVIGMTIYSEIKTKKARKQYILDLLMNDDRALWKGLHTIYQYQTEEEKDCEDTVYDNGVGFNALDARFLSSLAQQYDKTRRVGSVNQTTALRKRLPKYATQLRIVADRKQGIA
jgi:hypothetical protein